MRGYWQFPVLAAVLYGSQSLVNSSPVAVNSPATHPNADAPKLIGPSADYETLVAKGKKADGDLLEAIEDKHKDVELKPLDDHYYEERQPKQGSDFKNAGDLVDDFKEIGLDYKKTKYSSEGVYTHKGYLKKVLVTGDYYDQNGVIVGDEMFCENDDNDQDKKMKSSDIVFLIWKKFAGHLEKDGSVKHGMTDDIKKLMNFIGRNILRTSTVETIFKAHDNTKQPKDQVGHFKRDSKDAELEAFYALLGTESLSSYVDMLKDHHDALGNKRIVEIITYPRNYNDEKNKSGRKQISMVAKFEVYKGKDK